MIEIELWEKALNMRVERLAKLVKLNAPKYIICSEFILVLKALGGACPEELGQVWGTFMQQASRMSMNRCLKCGEDMSLSEGSYDGWCGTCMNQAALEEDNE